MTARLPSSIRQSGENSRKKVQNVSGVSTAGLDRSLPGHYPTGTLRIGPTSTIVDLVDAHENDPSGQGEPEALYVQNLIINPGATLNTN